MAKKVKSKKLKTKSLKKISIRKKTAKKKAVLKSRRNNLKPRKIAKYNRGKKIIPVGGMGFANGIMMRTANYMAIALQEGDDVELVSFKIKKLKKNLKFLTFPFIRGMALLLESFLFFSQTLFHKRKFVKRKLKEHPRHRRAYIRSYQYILYFIYFILFLGLFDYFYLKLSGWPTTDLGLFFYNFAFTISFLIFFIILFALVSIGSKGELEIFSYHGAEHKIINAYESGKALDIQNIKKASMIHPRCGSIVAFWSLIFLSALLVFFNWKNYNILLNLIVSVGLLFIAFSLAYEFTRFLIKRKEGLLFGIFIRPVFLFQSLVLRQPNENQIRLGLTAFNEVLRLEKNR